MVKQVNKISVTESCAYIIATGFGSGYSPVAPGTAGSLLALFLYWNFPLESITWAMICLLTIFIGIWAGGIVEKNNQKDPAIVVIDEMAGQWISLLFLPRILFVVVASFFIFRFFDIIKPFPARKSEALSGGIGIMADDIIAGIYTNMILQFSIYLTDKFIYNW